MTDSKTPEEYGAALIKTIYEGLGGKIVVEGDTMTFEDHIVVPVQKQTANMNVSVVVSLNGRPMEVLQAYAIALAANEVYLRALAEARASVQMQQTQIADLQSEVNQLRPTE